MPIDMKRLGKTFGVALDHYVTYAPGCEQVSGRRFRVGRKYDVDLNDYTCTCMDYLHRGHLGPCKHIVMAFIYDYAVIRDESEVH